MRVRRRACHLFWAKSGRRDPHSTDCFGHQAVSCVSRRRSGREVAKTVAKASHPWRAWLCFGCTWKPILPQPFENNMMPSLWPQAREALQVTTCDRRCKKPGKWIAKLGPRERYDPRKQQDGTHECGPSLLGHVMSKQVLLFHLRHPRL